MKIFSYSNSNINNSKICLGQRVITLSSVQGIAGTDKDTAGNTVQQLDALTARSLYFEYHWPECCRLAWTCLVSESLACTADVHNQMTV